jgi:hypothetical protein
MKKIAGTNVVWGSLIGLVVIFLLAVVCGCGNPTEPAVPYVVEIEIWGNEPDDLYLLEMNFYEEWGSIGWICGFDDYYASLPYTYTTTVYDAHRCVIRMVGSSTPWNEIQYTALINGEEPETMNVGEVTYPSGTRYIVVSINW